MSYTYENFDLHITRDEKIYAISKSEGEAGPARFQLDRNQLHLAQELIEQERANPELVRRVGLGLYKALFPDQIQRIFERSRVAAPDRRLRLRLRIESDELAVLPWEFLFDGDTFLGLSDDTTVVRYLDVPQPIQSLQVEGPLRILVVIASPANYPDLRRESQADELKTIFSGFQAKGVLEVEFLFPATYTGLIRRLRSNEFDVLHYLGYSAFDTETGQPVLLFEEENGLARKVDGAELKRELHRVERRLRLVLIIDCERSTGPTENYAVGVAMSIVRAGMPAVLAMQYRLPNAVARIFATDFYDAVARGLPIDAAVVEGRKAIKREIAAGAERPVSEEAVPGEWGAPVLFMRAEDGQIFQPRRVQQLAFGRSMEKIYAEIEKFKVETRDWLTRFFLDHLEAFILLSAVGVFVYWFTSRRRDALFISAVAVIYGCIWLLRSLFREKVLNTLDKLWRRRLITPHDQDNLAEQYLDFLKGFNALLNDQRYSWGTRALGLAIAVYSFLNLNFKPLPLPWRLPLQLLILVLAPVAGYVLGTLLWKMIATVIATRRLSYRFDLDVRPAHPDGCGGLKPLGDLYFANAWIVLLAGLFVAAWVLILSLSNALVEGANDLQPTWLVNLAWSAMGYYRWLRLYSVLLVILALVAIVTFLYPMYNTHRIMGGKGPRFRRKADSMDGEIAELERYIEEYGATSSEESAEISHRLEWLGDRYQRYNSPPLWPFDARVRFRVAGSLITMGVSFVTSILPAIARFLRSVLGALAR